MERICGGGGDISETYFGWAAFDLGHFGSAAAVSLLVVKLQILQALRQGQLLLDGHAQEGIQRLLLVLRRCQLPLHLVQLRHVFVTPADGKRLFSCSSGLGVPCEHLNISKMVSHLVANMALSEEKVAASSLRAFSSFLSFIMVSVTMAFSFSYLLFRLARAFSAVCKTRHVTRFRMFPENFHILQIEKEASPVCWL